MLNLNKYFSFFRELVKFKDFLLPTGNRFIFRKIIFYLKDINKKSVLNSKVLDLGCGPMRYKSLFTRLNYIGLDNKTENYPTNPDIIGTLKNIPLKENSVDLILSVWVLDDIDNLKMAFEEIKRVLKEKGFYYAFESQHTNLHNQPYDYFRFTPYGFKYLCSIVNLDYVDSIPIAGNFGSIAFSSIVALRSLLEPLNLFFLLPILYLPINLTFGILDTFLISTKKKAFVTNSVMYLHIAKNK